jgi:hypothetical protein
MALLISEFASACLNSKGDVLPVADGPPLRVTSANGAFTVGANARLIRIKGTGTITWPGVATAEPFDSTEWRGVRPGDTFTVT